MAAFETGEFVFADGRNWSYVLDSIVDKRERKTVDNTSISHAVVSNKRIPFSMEMLEMEARYQPNEAAVADLLRKGQTINRLDWAAAGPGSGSVVDTFKDLLLDESFKKTNPLTDLIKQSVPMHVNGERTTTNVFGGYFEFRNLAAGTYRTYNGTMNPDNVTNFKQGAPKEVVDWGTGFSTTEEMEATWHIPALSVGRAYSTGATWERVTTGTPATGEFTLGASEMKVFTSDAGGTSRATVLDGVDNDAWVRITDSNGAIVTLEVTADPTAPATNVETWAIAYIYGQLSDLETTGDMAIEVGVPKPATGINIQLVASVTPSGTYVAIPAVSGSVVGLAPGTSGSIHTWRENDTPAMETLSRGAGTGLRRYMGLQVVVTGASADVSFDVGVILNRG